MLFFFSSTVHSHARHIHSYSHTMRQYFILNTTSLLLGFRYSVLFYIVQWFSTFSSHSLFSSIFFPCTRATFWSVTFWYAFHHWYNANISTSQKKKKIVMKKNYLKIIEYRLLFHTKVTFPWWFPSNFELI